MSAKPASTDFRTALGAFATGVTIVTASGGAGNDVGVTANSFNSVSLDPPMVLWSLARKSTSLAAFSAASHFAVHILAADQETLSNRFAKPGEHKFAGLELARGAGGAPLLDGTTARFECRTAYQYDGGDHVIFVGEVIEFNASGRPPLLFHGGRYGLAARKAAALSEASQADEPSGSFGEDFIGYLLGRAHFQLYAGMRPVMAELGIDLLDHFVLSVLGAGGPRTLAETEAVIGYTGSHVTPGRARALAARGLVEFAGEAAPLALTEAGRCAFLKLTAAAKAIEENVLELLDEGEIAVLRHLLKHVIRGTDVGLPDLWRAGRASSS